MRLLGYVLTATALVILVKGAVRSTKTGDDPTEVVPRPLFFDSLRVSKTPSDASRPLDPQNYGENKTSDNVGVQKNEERFFNIVPRDPEAERKALIAIEDALVNINEFAKYRGGGLETAKLVEEKKINDQKKLIEEKKIIDLEKVLPLEPDELPGQSRPWDDAVSLSAARGLIRVYNVIAEHEKMRTKTINLIINVNERMASEKLVVERRIVDEKNFGKMLVEEFEIENGVWNYDDVVSSLTELEQVGNDFVPRVDPLDLMKCFISLEITFGMLFHVRGLKSALVIRFPDQVLEPLIAKLEWQNTGPFLANLELPTGQPYHLVEIWQSPVGTVDRYLRVVLPYIAYINVYRMRHAVSLEFVKDQVKEYIEAGKHLHIDLNRVLIESIRHFESQALKRGFELEVLLP